MKATRILTAIAGLGMASAVGVAGVAVADGANYGETWQEWFGAKIYGYVQIQPSYDDGGYHAWCAYHRFTREAGPSLDTGRMWTTEASSPDDTSIYSRQDWVWDSPLWGDSHTTRYYWDVSYY